MKFILPTIFIIISGILFFTVAGPSLKEVKSLKADVSVYNEALNNSKNLEEIRDSLLETYKNIKPEDKKRLDKFLPNTVNNIKFILEVEQIANLYNMPIKDIKFDPKDASESENTTTSGKQGVMVISSEKGDTLPYGVFPIEFTTEGSYDSFNLFLKDLEKNLRLVDVKSVSFKVPEQLTNSQGKTVIVTDPNIYEFTLKVETYWLK